MARSSSKKPRKAVEMKKSPVEVSVETLTHPQRLLRAAFGLQVRLVSLKQIIYSPYYSALYCIIINYTVIGLSPSYNKLYHSRIITLHCTI